MFIIRSSYLELNEIKTLEKVFHNNEIHSITYKENSNMGKRACLSFFVLSVVVDIVEIIFVSKRTIVHMLHVECF